MNRLQQEISDELQGEISRDHWIAMQAAEQFIEDGGPEDLDDEALSSLVEWLLQAQLDRWASKANLADEIMKADFADPGTGKCPETPF